MQEVGDISTALPLVRGEFGKLRMPSSHDKVYKDECVLSFDSPFSEGGLYVNVSTWMGYGQDYFLQDFERTGNRLYLHEKWAQVPREKPNVIEEEENDVPKSLVVGGEDNPFDQTEKFDIVKEHTLLVMVDSSSYTKIALPCTDSEFPEFVLNIVQAIIDHDGMQSKMQQEVWTADQCMVESKFAKDLIQLDNGKKISNDPSTWRCEKSGDTQNLWLNLSTGYIGGGRKNWDGSGGSGAALEHYEETGSQYPLCVKLGTITQHGADIYSYDNSENDLVKDPLLAQHLAHWGINIAGLEKTDKSMSELEADLNVKYDWSKAIEGGEELTLLTGPSLLGFKNIGSSCYMNSVLQTMFNMPETQERYFGLREAILANDTGRSDPVNDFAIQMSKLAAGLLTDRYAPESVPTDKDAVTLEKHVMAPRMFKYLVGKGHPEFSSGKQQDVVEYLQHLLDFMQKYDKQNLSHYAPSDATSLSDLFEFHIQDKFTCNTTDQVKYFAPATMNTLSLTIPFTPPAPKSTEDTKDEKDTKETESKRAKLEEEEEVVIPFEDCLANMLKDEELMYQNPSLAGEATLHKKNIRFRSFPKYLVVVLSRYYTDNTWRPIKITNKIPVPESLDLTAYARQGLASGEVEMPEPVEDNTGTSADFVVNEETLIQLTSMGFGENGCRRALINTDNANADVAMEWIFAHMEDTDFNDDVSALLATKNSVASAEASGPSPELIGQLSALGFSDEQCRKALIIHDNNVEAAAGFMFGQDNLDAALDERMAAASGSGSGASSTVLPDYSDIGEGKYEMVSMISHIGRNTEHGHYVCHCKKGDRWVLFDDDRVAHSKNPPLDKGFVYLFRKV